MSYRYEENITNFTSIEFGKLVMEKQMDHSWNNTQYVWVKTKQEYLDDNDQNILSGMVVPGHHGGWWLCKRIWLTDTSTPLEAEQYPAFTFTELAELSEDLLHGRFKL